MLLGKFFKNMPKEKINQNRRLLLANERTFLSWIRTSIGIMAFGFALERLEHFYFVSQSGVKENYLVYFYAGLFLVFLGASIALLSAYRFIKVQMDILNDKFTQSLIYDVLLAILLSSIGFLLVFYLIK